MINREDRLSGLLSGKFYKCCENCKSFNFDEYDPQGVGGTCNKDNEFSFCFEYCDKYEGSAIEKEYFCPICHSKIEMQYFNDFNSGLLTCKNNCFEKQENVYAKCPICEEGIFDKTIMHGSEYKKCNNCGFEISLDALLNLILKQNIN